LVAARERLFEIEGMIEMRKVEKMKKRREEREKRGRKEESTLSIEKERGGEKVQKF
jgi:hypothetical protein